MKRKRKDKYTFGLPALGFHYASFHTTPNGTLLEIWESNRFEVWVADGVDFFLYLPTTTGVTVPMMPAMKWPQFEMYYKAEWMVDNG